MAPTASTGHQGPKRRASTDNIVRDPLAKGYADPPTDSIAAVLSLVAHRTTRSDSTRCDSTPRAFPNATRNPFPRRPSYPYLSLSTLILVYLPIYPSSCLAPARRAALRRAESSCVYSIPRACESRVPLEAVGTNP